MQRLLLRAETMFQPKRLMPTVLALLAISGSAAMPDTTVRPHRGAPALIVDGKPIVPLMFMGWYGTGPKMVPATTEWQHVVLPFTSPEDADGPAGLQVRLGAGGAGSLWVDDVRYYEGTPGDPVGPNMQPAGDFEAPPAGPEGGEVLPPRWALFVKREAGADASWAYDDQVAASGRRSLRFDVRNGGPELWHVHLYLSGARVGKGKRYVAELKVRADPPRDIEIVALHQGEPWTIYPRADDPPFLAQVRLAARAGVHVHYFGVGMPWPQPGQAPDFSSVDAAFRDTIAADPQARIVVRYGVEAPTWWLDAHPTEALRLDDGSAAGTSISSLAWLAEACRHNEALVRYIEERWGDRIIAYHPCAQHTGEWFYEAVWTNRVPGFGPAVEAGFRRWLEQEYRTPARLARAWGRPVASFGEVRLPTLDERRRGELGEFYHPAHQRSVVDFFRFFNQAMADAVEAIAANTKRACGGRKAVIMFYGYLHEVAGCPAGLTATGHLGWHRLIDSRSTDIYCSPISYLDRENGGSGHFMAPVDSLRLHGKLWFNEDDTRTFLTPISAGFGRVETLEQTQWAHQRNLAQILPRRMGAWYMDLGGTGWTSDPRIWENIGRLGRLYAKHLDDPVRFHPEIAVIADERSPLYLRMGSAVNAALLSYLRQSLTRIGAPVGWYLLDDLLAGRVPKAKLYVMLNSFALDAGQRRRLRGLLQGQRATAVWFYAPGYVDPRAGTASEAHMRDLIGMALEPLPGEGVDRLTPDRQSPYCVGVVDAFGSGQARLAPPWRVVSRPGLVSIARTPAGDIGAAALEQDGWRSVYIGSLYAPPSLLRNIARRAGVWLYVESDDVVLGDGRFLAVCASQAGEKTLRLPAGSRVADALSGDELGTEVSALPLKLVKGETRLLAVTPRSVTERGR